MKSGPGYNLGDFDDPGTDRVFTELVYPIRCAGFYDQFSIRVFYCAIVLKSIG